MVGALGAMFVTFNGYVEKQHTSQQTTQQQQQASLNVQNVTYGGLTSYNGFSYSTNGAVNLGLNSNQHPLLPISNMNFSGGMQGWTASHSYHLVSDAALVQLSPQYITYAGNAPSPATLPFTLSIFNTNAPGTQLQIAKVSFLVDMNWAIPVPQPTTGNWGATQFATSAPSVVGNNITWVSNLPFDIAPGGNQAFSVSLNVPRLYGTFYDTVVLSWVQNNALPITDTAIATLNSTTTAPLFTGITSTGTTATSLQDSAASWASSQWVGDVLEYTSGAALGQSQLITANTATTLTTSPFSPAPNPLGGDSFVIGYQPGFASSPINPAPNGESPSGLTAGYDTNALTTTSLSGPGSMYLDFKPSANSVPITDGQQLSTTTDFTTAFSLNYKTVSSIVTAGCCSMTWESSLDSIHAPRNSLVIYQASLTSPPIPGHPNGIVFPLPVGGTSCGPSPNADDYVNPTTFNNFGPSGWVEGQVCFNPSTTIPAWLNGSIWYTGLYTLTIAVTITVPGAIPQTAGYPPAVSVHLDDIGLAFKQTVTSYYGRTTFVIPTGLSYNQVQGLEVGINATGANQNTTLYAYVTDNSHFVYNPPNWVQIGSTSLINSAVIDSVVKLPNAAYYVDSSGDLTVRVNATSSVATAAYSVKLAVWVVVQTFNQTRLVVELQNQSPTPIRLLSMVITGPGAALTTNFPSNFYFSPGQRLVLPETFTWVPGSTYTVTVTTANGLTFSRSFPAPLA